MEYVNPSSEPDFDAFLRESVEMVDTADGIELLHLAAEEKILGALREHGVPLLVGEDAEERKISTEQFMIAFRIEDEDYLYQTYLEDPLLQAETDFEHYLTEHVKNRVLSEYQSQQHLLASGVLLIAATEQPDAPSSELVTEQKKTILAANYVNGTIDADNPWFKVLNEVLPGEPFDPYDENDSRYIAEALAQQVEEEPTNEIIIEFTKEFLKLLDNAFAGDEDADNKINLISNTLPALLYLYQNRSVEIDAHIDEFIRELQGPVGLAASLKALMKQVSDNLEASKNRS
jgi:hypothetical protein